jgi:hypothetical protein
LSGARGEAVAVVTATGSATYFGRAAELVRIAHVESAEVKAVLGLVRNLSLLNRTIVIERYVAELVGAHTQRAGNPLADSAYGPVLRHSCAGTLLSNVTLPPTPRCSLDRSRYLSVASSLPA